MNGMCQSTDGLHNKDGSDRIMTKFDISLTERVESGRKCALKEWVREYWRELKLTFCKLLNQRKGFIEISNIKILLNN